MLGIFVASGAASCALLAGLEERTGRDLAAPDAHADGGGQAEGGSATEGGSPDASFCSSRQPTPSLCEDFDRPPLGSEWTGLLQNGARAMFDKVAVSSPNSRLFTMPQPRASATECFAAVDVRALEKAYTDSFRFEFDVRVGQLTPE